MPLSKKTFFLQRRLFYLPFNQVALIIRREIYVIKKMIIPNNYIINNIVDTLIKDMIYLLAKKEIKKHLIFLDKKC